MEWGRVLCSPSSFFVHYRYRIRKRVFFLSLLFILTHTSFNLSILLRLMIILLARRNYFSREGKVFSSQG